jgi:hypothetical protein
MAAKLQKFSDLGQIWFPSRFWCWELISFLYLVAILYLGYHGNGRHFDFDQHPKSCHILRWIFLQSGSYQKFCLTCVHTILRLRNFRMSAVVTKNVKNLKCCENIARNN